MAKTLDKSSFSTFFSKGQYETQVETLAVDKENNRITIGVPRENDKNEHRVALVPPSVRSIVGYGHEVLVEAGAGAKSHYSDHHYSEAGAQITEDRKRVFESDIILKSAPITMEEISLLKMNQILVSPLHIPIISDEFIDALIAKKVISIAMEYYQADTGIYPIVRMHSEIAGKSAILNAAELLTNVKDGRGALLGSISGVPPAKVLILGAGVVGENATKTALALGASVRIFDNDINKLIRIQEHVGRSLHTSSINPEYLAYQLTSADVVVGAIHAKNGRSPVVVTEQMVSQMKPGSVIIDVSIDQGGIFETSEVTTHSNPTFKKHEVIHYCVPNICSRVARTASQAVSNILTPLVLKIGNSNNISNLLYEHAGIRHGVYTYKGCLTNEYLSKRFDKKFTSLDLLLTSTS